MQLNEWNPVSYSNLVVTETLRQGTHIKGDYQGNAWQDASVTAVNEKKKEQQLFGVNFYFLK